MQDRPTVDELLDAVQGFLSDDLMPVLQGQPRFHARVAANAIAIVRRELATGEDLGASEQGRLQALLGEEGDRASLTEALAAKIRENDPVLDDAAVLAHLRQTALEKLAVSNPKYKPEDQA